MPWKAGHATAVAPMILVDKARLLAEDVRTHSYCFAGKSTLVLTLFSASGVRGAAVCGLEARRESPVVALLRP